MQKMVSFGLQIHIGTSAKHSCLDSFLHWDPDCLVQGPTSWISPKVEQVVFLGKGRRVLKVSLALEQLQACTAAGLGFSRARDSFGTLRPSPEKTFCSFPYRFSGKSRNSGLVPGHRDPNSCMNSLPSNSSTGNHFKVVVWPSYARDNLWRTVLENFLPSNWNT